MRGGFDQGTNNDSTNNPSSEAEDIIPSVPINSITESSKDVQLSSSTVSKIEEESAVSSSANFGSKAKTPPGFLRSTFPNLPWNRLPNFLTYARCIAIPIFIIHFCLAQGKHKNIISSLIFGIASATDYFDGFLARRWDISSSFGAFLDPVADKLMVSTALILLSGKYGFVMSIPTSFIIAREIAVSALREWMATLGKREAVKVGLQGKIKAFATMVSLSIILAVPDGWDTTKFIWRGDVMNGSNAEWIMSFGMLMLYLSAAVTLTSGSVYFRAAYPVLMDNK